MHIVITCGDPNGIGVEVMVKALTEWRSEADSENTVRFSVVANAATLKRYAVELGLPLSIDGEHVTLGAVRCGLLPCETEPELAPGRLRADAGALALEALERAAAAVLDGSAQAVVTMPIAKKALYLAGSTFPGQTEFFAARSGIANPMMVLCGEGIRVGLASIHLPLSAVPDTISKEVVYERISVLNRSLQQDFACPEARIAVLGLNPHAGENGEIGNEEIHHITPAIEAARADGIVVKGPFPADGFFAHGDWKRYDGILAMYHDQGLIPLKMLARGAGVNFTAGLPIVRTSPDHGTAFSLAGKGVADARSALQALRSAYSIARARQQYDIR